MVTVAPTYALTIFPEVVVLPESEVDAEGKTTQVTEGSTTSEVVFDCSKVSLKKGSSGDEVKKLQTVLKARGYYTRSIDGSFGKYTETAVKKLQSAQGNTPDGWFGGKTCNKLQQTSATSNNLSGTADKKPKEFVIKDFKGVPSMNADLEGLSFEVSLVTPYSDEKFARIRRLQKTRYVMTLSNGYSIMHEGYINDIKFSHEDDLYLISLGLVGYSAFLDTTVDYESTAKSSEHTKALCDMVGLKCVIDLEGLEDETVTLKSTKETATGGGGSGGAGWTEMSNNDCVETYGISARSYDISTCKGDTKIGNSSHNYAVDTKGMSAKEAIKDLFNRFKYKSYSNNRTCPEGVWKKSGAIRCNCADAARLTKALGEVHGLRVGIRHAPNHYYNLIEVDGKVYKYDCCFGSSGYTTSHYGGELCNNLTKNGGPWQ